MDKLYEIRDPIHGFVTLNEWEWDIIKHPAFQRLRRIRQLSMTDMVYLGAMHTRFEHSLGVMHVATRMFDSLVERERGFLEGEPLKFTAEGLRRDRVIVRLAALLHDCGHAPFSHAAEDLMPENPQTGKPFKHEHFSSAIIRVLLKDVIESHSGNQNLEIKADDIAQLIDEDKTFLGRRTLWKHLISSQLDADRSDYLLRDSHHAGVAYGHYDLDRLIATLRFGKSEDSGTSLITIDKSGQHVAEALIIARYMMFTQVYFQKTRRIYDIHLRDAVKSIFAGEKLPAPTSPDNLKAYLEWDDWRVMGCLKNGQGGEAGRKILDRDHDRMILATEENPSLDDIQRLKESQAHLQDKGITTTVDCAKAEWYKNANEVRILVDDQTKKTAELSSRSNAVKGLIKSEQWRLYVPTCEREKAVSILKSKSVTERVGDELSRI